MRRPGDRVRNPKQAIAIGLSEARSKGANVPAPRGQRMSKGRKRKRAR